MHVASEPAGTLADFMTREDIEFRNVRLYAGDRLPRNAERVRSVLIMGGPMNVYEEEKFPFLKEEDRFIGHLIKTSVPTLGICLGAQLIAKALGAKVYRAAKKEIGWDRVKLSPEAADDPVFGAFPPQLKVLQWHEDTFDLPPGAVHLASSKSVPNQAYRTGSVYGVQFHIEVNGEILGNWFKKDPELGKILGEYEGYRQELSRLAEAAYKRFFSLSLKRSSAARAA